MDTTAKAPPILIAEDDAVMARLLTELLKRLGRDIHHAGNGEIVLDMVDRLRPALLILDLNIPKRNGIEVLRLLRRDGSARDLKVLVLTALTQPETEDRVREAGADDFLTKPVDIRTLLDHVRALLPPQEGAA